MPEPNHADSIRTIAVVGAGQMGSGIAEAAAACGFFVRLSDTSLERARASRSRIADRLAERAKKGKIAPSIQTETVGRIRPMSVDQALSEADLVIEAATEDPALKRQIFGIIDAKAPRGTILASNTSSISITRLSAETRRPDRVVGMHFFNPVPVMKLVEIVRGLQTSEDTLRLAVAVSERLGKTVIVSSDSPGFLVNRILLPFLNEACFAAQENLGSLEHIDEGARLGLNHPMGPFELADFIGLDTLLSIAEVLHREIGDDKYRPATLLRNLVAAGWLGKKTGRGFYEYDSFGNKLRPIRLAPAP